MILYQQKRRMRLMVLLMVLGIGLLLSSGGFVRAQDDDAGRGAVHILEINGIINPPVANYLERALQEAEVQEASLVVIELDTPGGLDTSMRAMTQAILASPVPVAVYVTPPGARAASAGLFVLVSSHVAAMAPSTNTGAAHPVNLGGEQPDETLIDKAVHDAAASIRTLAEMRERNAEWAEEAVRESVSITENEALELKVIDVVANDIDHLLEQIQGWTVETAVGEVTLDVINAPRHAAPMNFAERFLHVLSDPNLAFILISIGTIGIIAELYNPGTLVPGITGVISLMLAFFALGNLPTNWVGVAFIVLAVILMVAELMIDGIGALGIGGTIAFLLGGLMLFRPDWNPFARTDFVFPDVSVSPWVLASTTALMVAFIFLVIFQLARARTLPIRTGHEQFIGQVATVRTELTPTGRVWFDSQLWNAQTQPNQQISAGQRVRITGVDSLTLTVEPIDGDGV
ncbi:MAG: nodulation protein NfeD [Chloroflexota bacterium]